MTRSQLNFDSLNSLLVNYDVRMRIMHISTRLILGGSQENTILSCEGQALAGNEVALVFGPIYGPEGSLRDRAQMHGGIELIETPNLVRQLAPIRPPLVVKSPATVIISSSALRIPPVGIVRLAHPLAVPC